VQFTKRIIVETFRKSRVRENNLKKFALRAGTSGWQKIIQIPEFPEHGLERLTFLP
jgi:hypothetical protein